MKIANLKIAWYAMGGAILSCLAACQSMNGGKDVPKEAPKDAQLEVKPVEDVRHGFSTPDAMYAIGRYLQGQQLYERAIAAYRRLLDAYPGHPDGRNALGLVYAAQGRYDAAIAEFEIAAGDAPDSARIRNNLGYAYLLQDRPAEAIAALQAARQLDPANRRAADNLEMALARAEVKAEAARAEAAARPVETVETAGVETAGVETVAAVDAEMPKPVATPPAPVEPAAPETSPVAAAATTPAAAPATPIAQSAMPMGEPAMLNAPATMPMASGDSAKAVRLEVSNGNGITGLARRTSQDLAAAGYGKARLTNERPYQLPATLIQYRPGFQAQAQTLQAALREGVPAVASAGLRSDVQLRLVLGKDVSSSGGLVAPTEQHVAQQKSRQISAREKANGAG